MKKIIISSQLFLISLLLFQTTSQAQSVYYGAGYNFGFGSFDSLNYVVDRYNETREYLNTDMKDFKSTKGMVYSFGVISKQLLFELGLQYNRSRRFAKGIDNTGIEQQRDLQLRMTNFTMDMGVPIYNESVTIVPGVGFNTAFVKYATRVNPPTTIKEVDYTKTDAEAGMHIKFFTKIFLGDMADSGVKFMIEPYYFLCILKTDITDLNKIINPNTYQNDPWKIKDKMSMFGLRFMLILG